MKKYSRILAVCLALSLLAARREPRGLALGLAGGDRARGHAREPAR